MSRHILKNLRLELFCAVLISLLAGVTVFGVSFLSGNTLLDKTVYGHSFANKMTHQQFSKLQKYVDSESISLSNLRRLNAWCSRGEKVYLTVYKDDLLIYESHTPEKDEALLAQQEFDSNMEDPNNEFILTLQNGVKVRAFLYYYAGDAYYFGMTVISGLLAFAAFSLCFVVLISRKVAYITRLKEDLDILSGGQLEYDITVIGNDELAELATGIDQMRRSIIRHQELEKQMRSANSELITAMSHDLRTPLTSLLAYLEIIERKKYRDEPQMEELIRKCLGQTMRIKQMADKLFSYFLAYATEWEHVEMETVDADALFQHILADYAYALESKGMCVEIDFTCTDAKISINAELFQRALDNLYSNLLKYAEPKKTIEISFRRKEDYVFLYVSNIIRAECPKTDSTSIGLITCRRIIEYHSGYFAVRKNDTEFHVSISLPIKE